MSTISIGSTNVLSVFKGTTAIKSVYRGAVKLLDFFSPLNLFANGEQGVWYEPSTTTAFRSTTDLTPCGYGDACGFLLDKSQGAGYSGGSFTGLGAEVLDDPDLDVSGSWLTTGNWAISGGQATASTVGSLYQNKTIEANILYLVTVEVVSNPGNWDLNIRLNFNPSATIVNAAETTHRLLVYGVAGTGVVGVTNVSGSGTLVLGRLSVVELPGNHATQTTFDNRPILARVPEGGRRNLLERTEEFDNAAWKRLSPAPIISDLGSGVFSLEDNSTSALAFSSQDLFGVISPNIQYTASIEVLKTTSAPAFPGILIYAYQGDLQVSFTINTDNGTTTLRTGVPQATGSAVVVDAGLYWRVSVTFMFTGLGNIPFLGIYPAVNSDASGVWDVNTTGSATFRFPQLELGSSATAYQKVVDEYDITEAGVDSLDYLSFDGTDDFMTSGTNADWNYLHDGTGGMFSMAVLPERGTLDGLRAIASTANFSSSGIGFDIGATTSDTWQFVVRDGDGSPYPVLGNTASTITDPASAAVITFQHGTAETPDYVFRENGASVYSGTYGATPSTSNASYKMFIGRRPESATLFMNGNLYGLIVRGAASDATEISNTEIYLGARSGFYAPTITGVPTIGVS